MSASPQIFTPEQRLRFPQEYRDHLWYPAFAQFHQANPHILSMILEELHRAKAVGITKVSIKNIIGHIRWNLTISTRSHDTYKINDAFTSLYALLIEVNYPQYADMFEQRELRSLPKAKKNIQ